MSRRLHPIIALPVLGLSLLCAAFLTTPADADITGGAFNITATTVEGDQASFLIEAPAGAKSWVWSSNQRVELISPTTGAVVAVLNPDERETGVEYIDDPVIGLIFSVQAGAATTTFTITSALLSFAPLVAEGRATAGFSLTDFDGDGATLTGIGDPQGTQGGYLAQYNGFAGTLSGTTFAELIPSMSATAYATTTGSDAVPQVGFNSIAAPTFDMSVMISFNLSPNDLASGTSVFVLQQRPLGVENVTWGHIKSLIQ